MTDKTTNKTKAILFDLDGTLVDTAPDLMRAHNYVMKKFGYPTKSTEEIRNLVGQGAGAMLGRSIWGQAKKEFGKVQDEKIKKEMIKKTNHFNPFFLIFSAFQACFCNRICFPLSPSIQYSILRKTISIKIV